MSRDREAAYQREVRRRRWSSLLGGLAFLLVFGLIGGELLPAAAGGLTFALVGVLLAPWFARRRTDRQQSADPGD